MGSNSADNLVKAWFVFMILAVCWALSGVEEMERAYEQSNSERLHCNRDDLPDNVNSPVHSDCRGDYR